MLHPGASYLRTDQSCPSLRQADEEGDPIYAVYRPAGITQAQVCAAVSAAGGDAYGKWYGLHNRPCVHHAVLTKCADATAERFSSASRCTSDHSDTL